ncbi:peptidyl-prolyl cis-trans isomerase B (cyclophilin B) [Clostridium intestinale DSM 6191]|jgi:peptidyl-prolyl cis-trans isomerase B (cyclophilin B)|uniref:Peptidyl-prolyl cis-trans isomerase n=2 Tax=Clostridium intestinale TaxID=36845 RepID=A0A1M5UWH1_9CLOT|nr:peptidyl-prolyl cis-trans isomerase B (cyclophilin B) [Clostridium intestinale DSM 6191]
MKSKGLLKKVLAISCASLILILSGCTKTPSDNATSSKAMADYKSKYEGKKPIVTIEMEDGSKITAELYPNIAPQTVDNFVDLIQSGFYDGLIFHRVIPGFMIQGGDPKGNGTGGSEKTIPGEFSYNGFENKLKHTRGVLSMARSQAVDSASSQFFIMVKDTDSLDGKYASFGKVTDGMDAVDKIVSEKRDSNDKPLTDQKMKKVTVDIK